MTEIATAVPGTVKEWFNPSRYVEKYPLPESGPWATEPNKMQWVDAATGLPCLIVRGPLGALCGYAGVYPGHPFHKHHYDAVDVDVHGGLTFSDGCAHSADESQGICHIPEPGTSDDVWWFGFDCSHCDDFVPGMDHLFMTRLSLRQEVAYRDVNYVAAQVTSLAAQLDVLGDVTKAAQTL
jgi:hypothetical protein